MTRVLRRPAAVLLIVLRGGSLSVEEIVKGGKNEIILKAEGVGLPDEYIFDEERKRNQNAK